GTQRLLIVGTVCHQYYSYGGYLNCDHPKPAESRGGWLLAPRRRSDQSSDACGSLHDLYHVLDILADLWGRLCDSHGAMPERSTAPTLACLFRIKMILAVDKERDIPGRIVLGAIIVQHEIPCLNHNRVNMPMPRSGPLLR